MKGFLLASVGCLILDSAGTLLSYVTELGKAKINVKIAECNSEIAKVSKDFDKEESMPVIGFQMPSQGEEDYEDD